MSESDVKKLWKQAVPFYRKLPDPDLRGWCTRKLESWDQHIPVISGILDPGCRFQMVNSGCKSASALKRDYLLLKKENSYIFISYYLTFYSIRHQYGYGLVR
jgi:hypothetical protein